jgi:tetratricopeptide (TPR) repeat protein
MRFASRFRRISAGCQAVALAFLFLSVVDGVAAEDLATNAAPNSIADTNTQEILRAYLQLQEQLHLTQLSVERNRKEARETATQSSEALAGRLQSIEQTLSTQRARELESIQGSNRVLLILAGTFASVGFVAMLLMSFFQWRTVNRLAQLPASFANAALGSGPFRKELTRAADPVVSVAPAEESSLRLLTAIEQLEKRLYGLEHTTRSSLSETASPNGLHEGSSHSDDNGRSLDAAMVVSGPAEPNGEQNEHVAGLLGKGQSMLSLDDPHGAIVCFDELLRMDPHNAEGWVRKGTALERLQQLDQAVECYDRAIQANQSLTIAYLHKGGLFNRMERFNEALECYEKALRTQEKTSV